MSTSRKIHHLVSDGADIVAVMQTSADSRGKWGIPVTLQTVRCSVANFDQLSATRLADNPNVEVIERWKVDARSKGPRSQYGETLGALIEEAEGHLKGPAIFKASEVLSTDAVVRRDVGSYVQREAMMREVEAFSPPVVPQGRLEQGAGEIERRTRVRKL